MAHSALVEQEVGHCWGGVAQEPLRHSVLVPHAGTRQSLWLEQVGGQAFDTQALPWQEFLFPQPGSPQSASDRQNLGQVLGSVHCPATQRLLAAHPAMAQSDAEPQGPQKVLGSTHWPATHFCLAPQGGT